MGLKEPKYHMRGSRGGTGVRTPTPEKHSLRVPYQYWSGSPGNSLSYKTIIQRWAIICPPAKRHLNGVSLAGRLWPLIVVFGSSLTSSTKPKRCQSLTPLTKLSGSAHASWIISIVYLLLINTSERCCTLSCVQCLHPGL